MKLQLATMLDLQEKMNQKVHPEWRTQGYEWYRAIWIECAELMDHYGWKWWKHQDPNHPQVALELIDIWHFGLSELLQREPEGASSDQLLQQLAEQLNFDGASGDFRQDVEAFAGQVLLSKAFDVQGFSRLLVGAGVTFADLYRSYVGKNVLNRFRQDHGYQAGTYQKVWQGLEDNDHLVQLLEQMDIDSACFQDDVYQALRVRYQKPVHSDGAPESQLA